MTTVDGILSVTSAITLARVEEAFFLLSCCTMNVRHNIKHHNNDYQATTFRITKRQNKSQRLRVGTSKAMTAMTPDN